MDRRLLEILCCPASRQPLSLLTATDLEAINRCIATSAVSRADGTPEPAPWKAGLVTEDRRLAYRIEDGIPVLLAEDAVSTRQITDFKQQKA